MADSMELKERQQQNNKTLGENNGGFDVVVKQPGKYVTAALIKPLIESSQQLHRKKMPLIESSQQLHRKKMISDSTKHHIRERKERDRRRLKQLEEDEIRRRERRKRQRLQQAKNIGEKSIYDAESKREMEVNMLNEIDRKDFEREMDKVLADGDLDDITAMITAHNLTKCKTNSLEKSLEVSYKLKKLADTNYPDAEDFHTLANKVEDFSINLLEPLKSDDMKRAIFEGDFDRISEKSVLFRQKKFISHPVVYNLLMTRWTGPFHHLRYKSWADKRSIKWLFLTIWTVFDVVLCPFIFMFLYLFHVIANFSKKECHAIVVMSTCNFDSLEDMQDLSSACFAILRPQHRTLICDQDRIKHSDNLAQHPIGGSFIDCLKRARIMFKLLERTAVDKDMEKMLIIMTDDKVDASLHELTKEAERIKNDQVRIVSVGFGIHPDIKELKTMTIKQQNVFLCHGNVKLGDIVRKIIEALRGQDIFDRYVQYFNTPYFIFLRDTLSYLALLGLHFAVCLQQSTLHFTALEWLISLFFIGRLLMEIYQAIMEKHLSHKFRKQSRDYEKCASGKKRLSREMCEQSDEEVGEIRRPNQHSTRTICRICLNIMTRYFSDWWNVLDLVTLLVYIIILILRSITWAEHFSVSNNRLLAVAGYFYGLNTMFLTLRVCGNIMESTKNTGSIQIALFQIIGAVVAIFGQFFAATLAFSLAITKVYVAEISYTAGKNSTSHGFCKLGRGGSTCWWESVKHLVWSLLGDPDIEPLTSTDEPSDILAKLLYGLFLIMAVVMLMNMMIALLSNTYQNVEDNAFYEWSYRRATTIRTYVNYHPVPVPFNVISFSLMLCRRFYKYICCSECCIRDSKYMRKIRQATETASFFDCLVFDLQAEYFSKNGYAFPLTESNKMDWVFKETEGNRRLIGHIANQVFTEETKGQLHLACDLTANIQKLWETRGIAIKGHQLTYDECNCEKCNTSSRDEVTRHHRATFLQPLSKEWPGFEILIQESLERRLIVIGVVPGNWHSPHGFAGCQGNSAGYHVDEGKIFDFDNQKTGIECEGSMAHRGDLIGCKILFEQSCDSILTVSFTLNGKVIGEAKVIEGQGLYPFIGIGWEGITLLFKLCPDEIEVESFNMHQTENKLDKVLEGVKDLQNNARVVKDRQDHVDRKMKEFNSQIVKDLQDNVDRLCTEIKSLKEAMTNIQMQKMSAPTN